MHAWSTKDADWVANRLFHSGVGHKSHRTEWKTKRKVVHRRWQKINTKQKGMIFERKKSNSLLLHGSRKAGESYADYYCLPVNYVVEFHVRWKGRDSSCADKVWESFLQSIIINHFVGVAWLKVRRILIFFSSHSFFYWTWNCMHMYVCMYVYVCICTLDSLVSKNWVHPRPHLSFKHEEGKEISWVYFILFYFIFL